MNRTSNEIVKPINFLNFLAWARQTISIDKRYYQKKSRPISVDRYRHWLVPDLASPIFIVGSPRSGTSFLGASIGKLPEISYHYEPAATKSAARYVYHDKWSFKQAKQFYGFVYAWLMRLHLDGDLRFAEKTPRNCFLIDFLHRAFPDAQFVHIIRDGRDAALSHSKKTWLQAAAAESTQRESSGYRHGPYARFWVEPERTREFETTTDIHRCIWAWRRHVDTILGQAKRLPTGQYHELRYEDLVRHPQQEAQKLLSYLRIDNPASAKVLESAFAQARPDSVGRWQREISDSQLAQINQESGILLKELGYVD